ncbi:unnamed protein product [Rotaria magnacalcarata]|uniref:Caspase family p20 domain-containing protein n=1 Tax=Rotaria magnacalcarata TaxID=392030 RepID=A0A816S9W4_9BILA|nr:unnamed protein product [Rotaria magnacalcarata]CAF4202061.1 unnamed protein product [Rotaria magnacalcarata]
MAALSGSMSKLHRKLALVIGNQSYSTRPLTNSVNDANDLADALRIIGFQVTLGADCTHQKMVNLIDDFANKIQDQDLVMFYFAGHGFQYKEQNYLLPVDADEKTKRETNIKFNSINAQETLESLSSQTSYVTIFILDCCREYLFDDTSKFRGETSSGSGLHAMTAPGGTLLQFACAPGSLAADDGGQDRNGLYTKHLLQQIAVPNQHIDLIFSSVGTEVYKESKGKQMPYHVSSIMIAENIYLNSIDADSKQSSVPSSKRTPAPEMLFTANDEQNLQATLPKPSYSVNIPANATWAQQGVTIAGSHGAGSGTNQLSWPQGLFVDDEQTMIIADFMNHRIIQWKNGDTTNGQVVAGGNGQGNRLNQLNQPIDGLVDKETDSLIICDWGNRRVVQWSRRSGTTKGKILIDDIKCWGLAMDEQRYLYVSDTEKHEVRRYQLGEKNGTLVAGGNGSGDGLNQLNRPRYLFIDRQHNVYVSDRNNHRVMKWNKDAKEGIVIAGGQGQGNALTQLYHPYGIFVDMLDALYVVDSLNHRVLRGAQGGKKQGSLIVGGNGRGAGANQLNCLRGLSFDHHGNLYVVDENNHRVQRFSIK